MKKIACCIGMILLGVSLTGCAPSKEAREARETGIENLNSGNYGEAIGAFEAALEARKGSVGEFEFDVLKYRGDAEYLVGDYAAAAHTYQVLLQVDQERAEYHNLNAMALAGTGDWSGALESYNRAKELNPQAAFGTEALLAVGEACENSGEYDRALTLYNSAISEGEPAGPIYNRMGLCAMEDGDYQGAVQYFDAGMAAADEASGKNLAYNRAVAFEYLGDYSGALTAFEEYAARYGASADVEHEIAFLKTR